MLQGWASFGGSVMKNRSFHFDRHDRIMIDNVSYRSESKEKNTHFLQAIVDGFIDDFFTVKTDQDISLLMKSGRLRVDVGWFSKTMHLLRVRHDNSNLRDLSEDDLRTVAWKKEWCVRFLWAAGAKDKIWRPKKTPTDIRQFIDNIKSEMDCWYLNEFGMRRKPGRQRKGEIRKEFDYPAPSTLRDWLKLYQEAGYRAEAFRPLYENCGNRNQLDERVRQIVQNGVESYCTLNRIKMADVYEDIEAQLFLHNKKHGSELKVSDRTVRRHINNIDPFKRDAGRFGADYALRKYAPVGRGIVLESPLERVEMDDWEFDLFVLLKTSSAWKKLDSKQKKQIERVRVTVTVAIDCVTRCIVGFHATPAPPSTAGAKTALRSVLLDKTKIAELAGAKSSWDMYGRPEFIVTDGGPVFRGEFETAVARSRMNRSLPDQDPRMRGTIESFFRSFKRLCRYFTGQSFSNVMEKGDYPGEDYASLTFDVFYHAAVRYIVDVYHHRKHRGLNNGTPFKTWEILTTQRDRGMAPPLNQEQIVEAFGLEHKSKITRNGVTINSFNYESSDLTKLHQIMGEKDVVSIFDPDDLGTILVRVPNKHLDRFHNIFGSYIIGKCTDEAVHGRTYLDLVAGKREVQDFLKAQALEGNPYRLTAHNDFQDQSAQALKVAGIPTHQLSQKKYDQITAAVSQKTRAALTSPTYSDDPMSDDDLPGSVIAVSARTKPKAKPNADDGNVQPKERPAHKPFSQSMNTFEDDDD